MSEPQHSKLYGMADYSTATDAVIDRAQRQIRVFDYSLEGLGYNSPERFEKLRAFLLANSENRLLIAVRDPQYIEKHCPRLLLLQKQFSHGVEIRATLPQAEGATDPFILIDTQHFARRFHFDDPRGMLAEFDPHQGRMLLERFGEIWDGSASAISPTISGL